jgi:predicted amidohydrolase
MLFMNFNIGLAQIAPRLGDIHYNLSLHLDMVHQAAAKQVDLLIFPELALTGYGLADRAFDVAIRTKADDTTFKTLLDASGQIDLVASFVEIDERHRHFITATYLSKGRMIHRHRKIYLPTYGLFDEGRFFAAGDQARAFDTRFGRMGLLICEDFWHPSLPYLLWQDGADYLVLISASVEHGQTEAVSTAGKVLAINRTYALLFTNFVVHVNRTGEEAGGRYWGGSTIFGPDGDLLIEGPHDEPALVMTTIEPSALRPARINLPLLRDERANLTYRELGRLLTKYD